MHAVCNGFNVPFDMQVALGAHQPPSRWPRAPHLLNQERQRSMNDHHPQKPLQLHKAKLSDKKVRCKVLHKIQFLLS